MVTVKSRVGKREGVMMVRSIRHVLSYLGSLELISGVRSRISSTLCLAPTPIIDSFTSENCFLYPVFPGQGPSVN